MSGSLTHTPSQVIRQLIIDLGLGTDAGDSFPVYATQMPNAPDTNITVLDTTGVGRGRHQVGGEQQELFGIQVIVRAADNQSGFLRARQIKSAFSEDIHLDTVTVTDPEGYGTATVGYLIYNISWRSGPLPVHDPDSDRKFWSLNVLANLEET